MNPTDYSTGDEHATAGQPRETLRLLLAASAIRQRADLDSLDDELRNEPDDSEHAAELADRKRIALVELRSTLTVARDLERAAHHKVRPFDN